jgi:hypothetical protein
MTLLYATPREKTVAADEEKQSWSYKGPSEPIGLTEEITSGQASPDDEMFPPLLSGGTVTHLPRSFHEALAEDSPEPISFRMSSKPFSQAPKRNPLRASFAALGQVKSSSALSDWIEAAATLKDDAVRLRHTHYSRHSAVLLALADALTFTEPSDSVLDSRTAMIERGLALLSEPLVTESKEEDFLVDLLSHGWNLTPASTGEPVAG